MPQLTCVVVTPEQTALEQEVDFVALPLYDGEIGIAANHSPMIGRLGYGELRLRSSQGVERYYVDGGFVQVAENIVSVLTGRAVPVEQVDRGAAEEHLKQALKLPAATPEEQEVRSRRLAQARAQLRLAGR